MSDRQKELRLRVSNEELAQIQENAKTVLYGLLGVQPSVAVSVLPWLTLLLEDFLDLLIIIRINYIFDDISATF